MTTLSEQLTQLLTQYLIQDQNRQHLKENSPNQNVSFAHQDESIFALMMRSIPLLREIGHEYQEMKNKNHELESQRDSKNVEIQNMKDEIAKLKESISHFDSHEDQLRRQLQFLSIQLKLTKKQSQQTHQQSQSSVLKLHQENNLLSKHIVSLSTKIQTLEEILQQEHQKVQLLQSELHHYANIESSLEATLMQLKEEYDEVTGHLQGEIQARDQKIESLEEYIAQKIEREHVEGYRNTIDEEQEYWEGNQYVQDGEESNTEEKLIKLSEQIPYQEPELIYLRSRNSSAYKILHQQERESNANESQKRSFKFQEPTLKKVTSAIQFFSNKSKRVPPKAFDYILQGSVHDASIVEKLSRKQSCDKTFIQRRDNRKINTDNQITQADQDVEIPIGSFNKDFRGVGKKKQMTFVDPYFIHYQLVVQAVKIEEDQEGIYGMLDIDMKPYFNELKQQGTGLHKWPFWIKEKLVKLHLEQTQE